MQRHHTAGDRALGEGSTPFMRAAKSGDVAVMRLLMAAGADPLLKQPNLATSLMLAAGLGWRDGSPAAPSYDQGSEQDAIEAIKLCMQAGIDINATTNTGETALHAAITGRGAESIVRFLVESGASLTALLSAVVLLGPLAQSPDSGIRLPTTDAHYGPVKDYVEAVPQADYTHAPAAAVEAFKDIKYGVRIHWGLYS